MLCMLFRSMGRGWRRAPPGRNPWRDGEREPVCAAGPRWSRHCRRRRGGRRCRGEGAAAPSRLPRPHRPPPGRATLRARLRGQRGGGHPPRGRAGSPAARSLRHVRARPDRGRGRRHRGGGGGARRGEGAAQRLARVQRRLRLSLPATDARGAGRGKLRAESQVLSKGLRPWHVPSMCCTGGPTATRFNTYFNQTMI